MLSIRLSRVGKKKQPLYRLIVTEKTRDPWGTSLEILGSYNPHTKEAKLFAERINHWIGRGAQPTATVNNLLIDQGIIKAEKVRAGKSQPGKKRQAEIDKEKSEVAAKAAAEAEPETPVAEETSTEPTENSETKEAVTEVDSVDGESQK